MYPGKCKQRVTTAGRGGYFSMTSLHKLRSVALKSRQSLRTHSDGPPQHLSYYCRPSSVRNPGHSNLMPGLQWVRISSTSRYDLHWIIEFRAHYSLSSVHYPVLTVYLFKVSTLFGTSKVLSVFIILCLHSAMSAVTNPSRQVWLSL